MMDDRIRKIVESNLGLVGDRLKKLNIKHEDTEDMFSVGVIGLIKAAEHYDQKYNTTFATYATRCITNEIFMEFRRRKKHDKIVSLEAPISSQEKDNLVVGDMIRDENTEIEEQIVINENIERTLDVVLNYLTKKERLIILLSAAGYTQNTIRERLGYSQSYISRLMTKIKKMIKEKTHSETYVKNVEKYLVHVVNGKIILMFDGTPENIERKISTIYFQKETPRFSIKPIDEKVGMIVPVDTDSMEFIALVIEELEK